MCNGWLKREKTGQKANAFEKRYENIEVIPDSK